MITYGLCPYCETHGLVTTMKSTPGGFEVRGTCSVCGYTCDSDYAHTDQAHDLPQEFTQPIDAFTAD
jgi:hypothetical protein